MGTVILYTTAGCHLCEEAEAMLRQLDEDPAVQWQAVDIAAEPALVERYGIRIPVIRRPDTDAELGWPFDLAALRRYLDAP